MELLLLRPPPLFLYIFFLRRFVCAAPGIRSVTSPNAASKPCIHSSFIYDPGPRYEVMNLHRRHLWVEMDRPIADHKLCEWIVRRSHVLLFPGSFWHVKPDCNWANAISKALHLTEGAVWHNCQWGHSLHDWEEKIRWWCWGLRAPVAVGNLPQAIALALCLKPDLEADHTNFKNLSLTLKLWPWSSRQY